MEWLKKIVKCKIRGIHKIPINGDRCLRCRKRLSNRIYMK